MKRSLLVILTKYLKTVRLRVKVINIPIFLHHRCDAILPTYVQDFIQCVQLET